MLNTFSGVYSGLAFALLPVLAQSDGEMAVANGLTLQLGATGSLLGSPLFGASFRLAAVLTDAPLAPTKPRSFGVDDFCRHCRVCENACPPEALAPDKQLVRGMQKWYVDFDRCPPFFNQTQGCAICIAVCPWSRPGAGLNLAEKWARRRPRDTAGN